MKNLVLKKSDLLKALFLIIVFRGFIINDVSFALEQTILKEGVNSSDCYFWGVHGQAEVDLLIMKNGKKYGYEFKYSDRPKITKSMRKAIDLLGLDSFSVVYPGDIDFDLADDIQAICL